MPFLLLSNSVSFPTLHFSINIAFRSTPAPKPTLKRQNAQEFNAIENNNPKAKPQNSQPAAKPTPSQATTTPKQATTPDDESKKKKKVSFEFSIHPVWGSFDPKHTLPGIVFPLLNFSFFALRNSFLPSIVTLPALKPIGIGIDVGFKAGGDPPEIPGPNKIAGKYGVSFSLGLSVEYPNYFMCLLLNLKIV